MRVRPAALIIDNDSILTMQYSYGNTDVYMLPGGNPDPGESLREALQRELHEELGVEVQVGEMVLCGEVIDWGGKEDTLHCVFEVKGLTGQPELNAEHTTAVAITWVPVSELQSLILYPQVGVKLLAHLEGTLPSTHIGRIEQPFV
ncbi:NUDIX domain-containing protein [Telluribacter sp. SYSU D00476]|uniref:NUDIX domain-containing protein n=1 Tax=Telluribacter sp. SYSU D00476 TaxID=2811430 RepID=UPI001FF4828A|nr:NUDIX domain-containing protein [Telluribacter sp. SYSU D00476]